MRIASRSLAALVLALVAYACARRSAPVEPPPDAALPERAANPDEPTRATITVAVTDRSTGEAVEGVGVLLFPPAPGAPIRATTRMDGTFTFPPQPPGAFTLEVDDGEAKTSRRAEVDAGERWRPTFTVETIPRLLPTGERTRHRLG